jgi:hypothetical protein
MIEPKIMADTESFILLFADDAVAVELFRRVDIAVDADAAV